MKKVKWTKLLQDRRGSAYIGVLVFLLCFFMVLVVGLAATSVLVKYNTVRRDVQKAIVDCEVENYDKQYRSLIESESFSSDTDYSGTAFTGPFFSALERRFSRIRKSEDGAGVNYTVLNTEGQTAFVIDGLTLTVSTEDRPLHDTKTKRLCYEADGTLRIPLGALGFQSVITVPLRVPASFQYVV